MIFHIAHKKTWEVAKASLEYKVESLYTEGFIHCSTRTQVITVANFLFRSQKDLVLLKIDDSKVRPEIKYEGEDEEKFPHIYGPLNLDAVLEVIPFPPNPDGSFSLPEGT